jgi:putative glutathione S-transferase
MNQLVDGEWTPVPFRPRVVDGAFVRPESAFRDRITADGSSGYPAAVGRYHLYVSLACPWAHRTLIFRALKGLEQVVDVSVVHPHMGERGWSFDRGFPGTTGDAVHGDGFLYEAYARANPDYTGIITVPVLWDRERETIVNNESSEIIRMFNDAFDGCGASGPDFYPEPRREAIGEINAYVYDRINNGVYRAGFATTQARYDQAVGALFEALDTLEKRLGRQRYLVGEAVTEADWRLFTTLVRFDAVYVGHFKCNLRRLVDYPNLWAYTRELYQWPGVAATVDLDHIRHHYYTSHPTLNPKGIVPMGPQVDFTKPHGRG